MHTWILIYWLVSTVTGVAPVTTASVPGFTSQQACERAAMQMRQVAPPSGVNVYHTCTSTDGQP